MWVFPCSFRVSKACEALDLKGGGTVQPGDGKAGFLVTSRQPVPDSRFFIVGGSTAFGGGGSYVRYVGALGSDSKAGGSNNCESYLLPCRTLKHALAVGGYSSVIELGAGTFAGPVTLDKTTTIVGASTA